MVQVEQEMVMEVLVAHQGHLELIIHHYSVVTVVYMAAEEEVHLIQE